MERLCSAGLQPGILIFLDLPTFGVSAEPNECVCILGMCRAKARLYSRLDGFAVALEAYIRVIEEVKRRSGIADDGDSLMNRAFACDKQTPVIQFNTLQTDAERDEQKGLMFIFKGIVGLRNYKAHTNTLFDDPHRAHDYLALASLLMRLLEIAVVNPRP